jgi:glycosyltransferase involved in cell wall biosynthesis
MNLRVCIIQPVMKGYRLPFFIGLDKRLSQVGITLQVVYGTPWPEEAKRGDHVDLLSPLGRKVESRMLFSKLFFLPVLRPWLSADLVIVEHANKHLMNYLLAVLWAVGVKRIAYWGHGRDRQANADSRAERFKRRSMHWADWWFAYTAESAAYVAAQGFPADRITVVENAIDTRALRDDLAAVSEDELEGARVELGWNGNEQVAVFCGSLYQNKRLDLLFDAADRVHRAVPLFRLLIIGGGPLGDEVARFASDRPWVKAVGPKFGHEKTVLLRLATMWLNPGLVGLGILDAFCAGLPVLTTDLPLHSPEIEYLVDGENGLIVQPTVDDFADVIERLLKDAVSLEHLRNGALIAAQRYSIETMVENFAVGIERCLRPS